MVVLKFKRYHEEITKWIAIHFTRSGKLVSIWYSSHDINSLDNYDTSPKEMLVCLPLHLFLNLFFFFIAFIATYIAVSFLPLYLPNAASFQVSITQFEFILNSGIFIYFSSFLKFYFYDIFILLQYYIFTFIRFFFPWMLVSY